MLPIDNVHTTVKEVELFCLSIVCRPADILCLVTWDSGDDGERVTPTTALVRRATLVVEYEARVESLMCCLCRSEGRGYVGLGVTAGMAIVFCCCCYWLLSA